MYCFADVSLSGVSTVKLFVLPFFGVRCTDEISHCIRGYLTLLGGFLMCEDKKRLTRLPDTPSGRRESYRIRLQLSAFSRGLYEHVAGSQWTHQKQKICAVSHIRAGPRC